MKHEYEALLDAQMQLPYPASYDAELMEVDKVRPKRKANRIQPQCLAAILHIGVWCQAGGPTSSEY